MPEHSTTGDAAPEEGPHEGPTKDGPAGTGRRIVYCHCKYANVLPAAVKEAVLRGLVESGVAFDAVPDLCELSAQKHPSLARLSTGSDKIHIAACYPRAVKWLFQAAGAPLAEDDVEVCNLRDASAEEVLAEILGTDDDDRLPDAEHP